MTQRYTFYKLAAHADSREKLDDRIQFSILFSWMTIRVAFDYFGIVPVSYDKRCDIQR